MKSGVAKIFSQSRFDTLNHAVATSHLLAHNNPHFPALTFPAAAQAQSLYQAPTQIPDYLNSDDLLGLSTSE